MGLYEWFWASGHEMPCSRFVLALMAGSSVWFTLESGAALGSLAIVPWGLSVLLLGLLVVAPDGTDLSLVAVAAARTRLAAVTAVSIAASLATGLDVLVVGALLTGVQLVTPRPGPFPRTEPDEGLQTGL